MGHKKTTIKSLFQKEQLPKKLPTLNESMGEKKGNESSINESFAKMQAAKLKTNQEMERSGLNHSIVDKFSGTFRVA